MNMTMTERDKKLLVLLAVVVIVYVFTQVLIFPELGRSEELDEQIMSGEDQRFAMEMKKVELPGMEKQNEELREEYEARRADYYPMLTSQSVDREITGILLDHGMEIDNMEIRMADAPSALAPYAASELAEETQEDGAPVQQTQVYAAEIAVTCSGSERQMQELLDFLTDEKQAIAVRQYEYVGGQEEPRLKITLQLYMCAENETETDSGEEE